VPKYSREVPVEELEREEFNLNIRRYVDNSPPPEPHDVRAHLHGGIPVSEIALLTSYFDNYAGLRSLLFKDRDTPKQESQYSDFAPGVGSKENIKTLVESAPGLQAKHAEFQQSLDAWWTGNVKRLEKLPETQNVFEFRRQCIDGLSKALVPHNLLDVYQARGAVAAYIKSLDSDLKSIAASGWGPELIPDDEILQSQFPEVLEQIEQETARIAELEGLFAAVSGGDEDEGEVEVDAENGVLPKLLVKSLKEEKKNLGGEIKEAKKRAKNEGRSAVPAEVTAWEKRIEEIDAQLARHVALDDELKTLKAHIREVEKQKEALIASARAKITESEAKKLILARFKRMLTEQFDGYLRQYQRAFIAAIENLWSKYAVTTKQILAERDREAAQLNAFLKELGYE
jgi:type I restriction enzyme M protein